MGRTAFIEHRGVSICYLDFANVQNVSDGLRIIEEAKAVVTAQPLRSVRTLTNVTGSRFDAEVTTALQELARDNAPYVRAGAVVGLSGVQRLIFQAVMRFSGRELRSFSTDAEAKDWLAEQP